VCDAKTEALEGLIRSLPPRRDFRDAELTKLAEFLSGSRVERSAQGKKRITRRNRQIKAVNSLIDHLKQFLADPNNGELGRLVHGAEALLADAQEAKEQLGPLRLVAKHGKARLDRQAQYMASKAAQVFHEVTGTRGLISIHNGNGTGAFFTFLAGTFRIVAIMGKPESQAAYVRSLPINEFERILPI
jgi:hypothetical protein